MLDVVDISHVISGVNSAMTDLWEYFCASYVLLTYYIIFISLYVLSMVYMYGDDCEKLDLRQ